MRKLLRISYLEHKTNDWVRNKINFLVGPGEPFLATVKRRKLARFGHVTPRQPPQNHPSEHLGGWATPWSAEEMLVGQYQRVDILPMQELLKRALCRKDWKRISADSPSFPPDNPVGQGNTEETNHFTERINHCTIFEETDLLHKETNYINLQRRQITIQTSFTEETDQYTQKSNLLHRGD